MLGTFLGLAGGVGSAVGALGGSSNKDIQVTIDAMQSLLQSASLAFITSIFGILYSMLFSIIEKFFIRRCEREIAELVDLLEEKFPKIPSDSQINLMLAQLKVIQGHQKEQVGQGSKEVETLENLLLQLKKVSFIRVETNGNKES